jgi:hypothetical protein
MNVDISYIVILSPHCIRHFFAVLGFEIKSFCLPGKCSSTWTTAPSQGTPFMCCAILTTLFVDPHTYSIVTAGLRAYIFPTK